MEAEIIQLRPYANWSVEELQAALDHKVEQAKRILEQADILIGELATRGIYVPTPDGGDVA